MSQFRIFNWCIWTPFYLADTSAEEISILKSTSLLCYSQIYIRKDRKLKELESCSSWGDLPFLFPSPVINNSKDLTSFCLFPHFYIICPGALLTTEASWIFFPHHFFLSPSIVWKYVQRRFIYSKQLLTRKYITFLPFCYFTLFILHSLTNPYYFFFRIFLNFNCDFVKINSCLLFDWKQRHKSFKCWKLQNILDSISEQESKDS